MSLARLISRGQSGLDAYEVSVEVHLSGGLPAFTITGLPAPAVRESRDRVRSALLNSGFGMPASRITAHLGPADIPKQGGRFDLAIALGIVQARMHKSWQLEQIEFLGELSLGGQIRAVTGVVPAARAALASGRRLVVPAANAVEGSLVPGADLLAATSLSAVVDALDGKDPLPRIEPRQVTDGGPPEPDLDEVKGHAGAKRALAVAAAGEHNLLIYGV
jgi:magnesium chelatase family protein